MLVHMDQMWARNLENTNYVEQIIRMQKQQLKAYVWKPKWHQFSWQMAYNILYPAHIQKSRPNGDPNNSDIIH